MAAERQDRDRPLPLVVPAEVPTPVPAVIASELDIRCVELEMRVSPTGRVILPGDQQVKLSQPFAGRTVTVWANDRSIHVLLDGHVIRTRPSRLSAADLYHLHLRGARAGRPEPAPSAAPTGPLPPATVVEVDRTVNRDGEIHLGGQRIPIAARLAGRQVTLRLDGHLMHVIAGGLLATTLPAPIPAH